MRYNGGLIYAGEAERERSVYIEEILNRNNMQTGEHLGGGRSQGEEE